MPDYAVATAFTGKDKVSHLFNQMEKAAGRYSNTAKAGFRGVGREADHASTALRNASKHGYNFGAIVKGILAANAIRGGIGMVGSGLQKAAGDYLQFGDTMTGAVARFEEVDVRSAAFGQSIDSLGKQVRTAMLGTRYSAVDGAKALNELAKANYNSQQAMAILPNLTAFATASQEDLAEATMASSNVLGAFGMKSKDVQVQLRNHILLNDQLTKTALMSTGNMGDLLETLKNTAPISKEFGLARETVLALTVALDNAGIKGDIATTAMKKVMTSLYASNMRTELEANGVHPFDKLTGKARKVTVVLGELSESLDKLREDQRIPIIKDIFGIHGLGGSVKMLRELQAAAEYEEKLQPSAVEGLADRMAKAANSSTFAKLVMLGNAALEKSFRVLDQYAGKADKGIEWLTEKIMKFDVRPLIQALNVTGKAVWALYEIARPFIPILPYLTMGFVGWRVALKSFELLKTYMIFKEVSLGIALMEGALAGGGLAAGLWAVVSPLAALVALLPGYLAFKSAMTGEDNFISRAAQWLGVVPKLAHDDEGHVTGRSSEQYDWTPWANGDAAPNAKEARASATRIDWRGYLQFGNLPEGSTMNGQPMPRPAWEWGNLGANPK